MCLFSISWDYKKILKIKLRNQYYGSRMDTVNKIVTQWFLKIIMNNIFSQITLFKRRKILLINIVYIQIYRVFNVCELS